MFSFEMISIIISQSVSSAVFATIYLSSPLLFYFPDNWHLHRSTLRFHKREEKKIYEKSHTLTCTHMHKYTHQYNNFQRNLIRFAHSSNVLSVQRRLCVSHIINRILKNYSEPKDFVWIFSVRWHKTPYYWAKKSSEFENITFVQSIYRFHTYFNVTEHIFHIYIFIFALLQIKNIKIFINKFQLNNFRRPKKKYQQQQQQASNEESVFGTCICVKRNIHTHKHTYTLSYTQSRNQFSTYIYRWVYVARKTQERKIAKQMNSRHCSGKKRRTAWNET